MTFPSQYDVPFFTAVALGLVPGFAIARGIGLNPDIDAATVPEDCWGGSGMYPWLSTTTNLEMVSTSANDTAAGTGARSVTFTTLNGLYVAVPQTLATNGTTAVPLPTGVLRNNGGRVLTAGSLNTNDGDIILRDAGGGATRGIILAGTGVMLQAAFTVPAGFTVAVRQILIGVDSPVGASGLFASLRTYFKSPTTAALMSLPLGNSDGQPYNHFADPPVILLEKTDFSLPIVKTSGNNTIVTAAWNGIIRTN